MFQSGWNHQPVLLLSFTIRIMGPQWDPGIWCGFPEISRPFFAIALFLNQEVKVLVNLGQWCSMAKWPIGQSFGQWVNHGHMILELLGYAEIVRTPPCPLGRLSKRHVSLEEYGDLDLSCTTATSCDTDSIFAPRYFENLGYQFLTSPKSKEVSSGKQVETSVGWEFLIGDYTTLAINYRWLYSPMFFWDYFITQ